MKTTTYAYLHFAFFVLLLVGVGFGISSCRSESPIISELGEPLYPISDSDDPTDHLIYTEYAKTGVQIIYNFDPRNAKWNLGSSIFGSTLIGGHYVSPIDTLLDGQPPLKSTYKTMISENVRWLVQKFLPLYPEKFRREVMPLRFFMCDSIMKAKNSEHLAFYGRDNVAINMYKPGETYYYINNQGFTKKRPFESEEEYFHILAPQLHGNIFQQLFTYRKELPAEFMAVSGDYYEENLQEVKLIEQGLYSVKEHGFWTYDKLNSFKFARAVSMSVDVFDWITRMTSMSETQIRAEMEGYPLMVAKYEILRLFVKSEFGIDIQEIGNQSAAEQ